MRTLGGDYFFQALTETLASRDDVVHRHGPPFPLDSCFQMVQIFVRSLVGSCLDVCPERVVQRVVFAVGFGVNRENFIVRKENDELVIFQDAENFLAPL